MVGRDVARSLKDGSIHTLTVPLGPTHVVFDGVTEVPIDRKGISGRLAVDGRGVRYATVIGWDGGSVLVRDDGRLVPMNVGGRFWSAIRPLAVGVEVYAQDGAIVGEGESVTINVYDENGTKLRSFSAPYGSMGILQIAGDNAIVSSVIHSKTVAGRRLFFPMTVDGWTVGQSDGFVPPGGSDQHGTLELIAPDGTAFYANVAPPWNGYTNMPSHLAVDASGMPFVAINDPTAEWLAPEPQSISWSRIDGSSETLASVVARNRPSTQQAQSATTSPAQRLDDDDFAAIAVVGLLLLYLAWESN